MVFTLELAISNNLYCSNIPDSVKRVRIELPFITSENEMLYHTQCFSFLGASPQTPGLAALEVHWYYMFHMKLIILYAFN